MMCSQPQSSGRAAIARRSSFSCATKSVGSIKMLFCADASLFFGSSAAPYSRPRARGSEFPRAAGRDRSRKGFAPPPGTTPDQPHEKSGAAAATLRAALQTLARVRRKYSGVLAVAAYSRRGPDRAATSHRSKPRTGRSEPFCRRPPRSGAAHASVDWPSNLNCSDHKVAPERSLVSRVMTRIRSPSRRIVPPSA